MSYKLFLDDERTPKTKGPWVVARSYDEFVSIIKEKGAPIYISFDHDLGEEKSGLDCVKWLINNNIVVRDFNVHSANPVGRDNIISKMKSWIKFVDVYGVSP